ncbi:helix-turn-helix transcriptional regulator [Roseateles sp. LKC17W]|uniref:LuxR C-terminal-related transcriptional regulator n=1 Tax=Pelomonas margarita TaxID=3299031 RepID=A0ABW7FKD6_9BURK
MLITATSKSERIVVPTASPHQVLGALPQPMLVMCPDRRLLFANASAERLLAEQLGQVRADHLMSLGQLGAAQLGEVLTQAAQGTSSRTGLWFTPGLSTGWLHAAPLAPTIAQACDWPLQSVLLAMHLDQPALTQAARIDALTRQCRLSQAERHVLLLLADGEPVDATSRHLGLCVSTVRSHVRSLLGKTQAPNLMQLLRWTGSAQALPH